MKNFLITIVIVGIFLTLVTALYRQGNKIDSLKAETLRLQVKNIEKDVVIDELRANAKLNDQLASGNYPKLPLPQMVEGGE